MFGSIPIGLAYLGGERLIALPNTIYLNDRQYCTGSRVDLTVSNQTAETVKVLSCRSKCVIIPLEDYPITLSPGETRSIPHLVEAECVEKHGAAAALSLDTDSNLRPVIEISFESLSQKGEGAGCVIEESDFR